MSTLQVRNVLSPDGGVSDNLKPVTASAWVVYDGINDIMIDSYNVSSVVDNSVGDYTVNFTNSMLTVNYAPVSMATDGTAVFATGTSKTVGSFQLRYVTSTGAANDADNMSLVIFGGQ